jgi:hypothetical protein
MQNTQLFQCKIFCIFHQLSNRALIHTQQHAHRAATSSSMGAAGSKDGEPGIITVVPAAAAGSSSRGASPLPHTSSRPTSRLSNRSDTPAADPLMHHLQELKAQGARLDPALFATAAAAAASLPASTSRQLGASNSSSRQRRAASQPPTSAATADPDSLLADLSVAQQLSSDTALLNAAVTTLVTDHQAWHAQHIQALIQNQDYITRTMDQAEVKADKAVRHVQQQTTKLKVLSAGLQKAVQLPAVLQQLAAATEALEGQLAALEQRADAASAAAAAAAAAGSGAAAAGVADSSSEPTGVPHDSSSTTGGGTAGRLYSRTGSGSSSGRAGSFRSWLGVGSRAVVQQQQQQQQQPSHTLDDQQLP